MAANYDNNKKSSFVSVFKELVGSKRGSSSKETRDDNEENKSAVAENDEKKPMAESPSTSGKNTTESTVVLKVLDMYQSQLNVKSSALEEEAAKRIEAELKVKKLEEELMKRDNEKKMEENSKTLTTIQTLIDVIATEDDNKGKLQKNFKGENKQNFQQGFRGKGYKGKAGCSKQNTSVGDNKSSTGEPNFGENLNDTDQSNLNKCQNKKTYNQNFSNFKQNNNSNPPMPLLNQPPNNFNQQQTCPGPMNNFNSGPPFQPPTFFNRPPPPQPPPLFNQQYPNPNAYQQHPNNFHPGNNFNQPGPLMGFNNPPIGTPANQMPFPNQFGNVQHHHEQFRNARGRGGFRGRGNFRGNARGGGYIGKKFGGNNSACGLETQDKDGFVIVSKNDNFNKQKNHNPHNAKFNNVKSDGQNIQKAKNIRPKKNREQNENKDKKDKNEKEKDEDITDSKMQSMMDMFSKMVEGFIEQPTKNVQAQTSKPAPAAANVKPKQEGGAVKKAAPGNAQNKVHKKKENYTKDGKGKNSPLKLSLGLGHLSEEELKKKNVNLDQEVKDLLMLAKSEGKNITEQPKTLRDMVNFKKQYPNCSTIVINDE